MYIINYILNVPIFIMLKELIFKKTSIIHYQYDNDIIEKFINSVSIFNILNLFYEIFIQYICFLDNKVNEHLFLLIISRDIIMLIIFHIYTNYNNLLKIINFSLYINIVVYSAFYHILSFVELNEENRGYIYLMILFNNIYFIITYIIIILFYKKFNFIFENSSNNKVEHIKEDLCCICLELMQCNDSQKLNCCKNYIHICCMDEYIDKSNKKCPLCREQLKLLKSIIL
jgi:hypothetical protein